MIAEYELLHADTHNPAQDGPHGEGRDEQAGRDLHAKCEDSDDHLEYQSQGELPQSCVHSVSSFCYWDRVIGVGEVPVDIVTDVVLVGDAALGEQEVDQLAGVHPGVLVGECKEGRDTGDHNDLNNRVLTELGGLAELAPVDICTDEETAKEATNNTEEEERDQLEEEPGFVVLDIEEDAVLVSEGVDGLKNKSSDQGAEERSPECLEGEILAHLLKTEKNTTNKISNSN